VRDYAVTALPAVCVQATDCQGNFEEGISSDIDANCLAIVVAMLCVGNALALVKRNHPARAVMGVSDSHSLDWRLTPVPGQ
jgi:hypothetical protein